MVKLIMVDVEADGPVPGLYSMTEFAAVVVDRGVDDKYKGIPHTFHVELFIDTDQSDEGTLKAMGWTREGLIIRPNLITPRLAMKGFEAWLQQYDHPAFISDNNGFDWQFINYYFHKYLGKNPFGHSSMNANNFYKGLRQNIRKNFKELRRTKHDHNPLNDALGNAEAMLCILDGWPAFARGIDYD